MKKTLVRGFRSTLSVFASRVQIDNVSKTLSFGSWRVPFEWILDRDILSFDKNCQRGCVVCPDLVQTMEAEQIDEAAGSDEVTIAWRTSGSGALSDIPTPPGSIPCVPPIKSKIHLPSEASEHPEQTSVNASQLESPNMLTKKIQWTTTSIYGPHEELDKDEPPQRTLVNSFNSNPETKKSDVVQTIEKFGFCIGCDEALRRTGASTSTALVQKRCDAAENMIRTTFSVLRNSHYGAMSTWSDSDSWKEVGVTLDSVSYENAGGALSAFSTNNGAVEFKESSSHLDGAYMSSLLDLHTDCTYFMDCPKVQVFGCIFSTPNTVGGETTLADGFYVAELLRRSYPECFDILTRVPVGGRYKKEGRWYESYRPVISVSPSRRVERITFNNSDRIPMGLALSTAEEMRDFYKAYYKFHQLVHENSIRFLLKPGMMLFFDNHRVLHGRLQFSGPRVMCGAYIASDEYFSALRMSEINQ